MRDGADGEHAAAGPGQFVGGRGEFGPGAFHRRPVVQGDCSLGGEAPPDLGQQVAVLASRLDALASLSTIRNRSRKDVQLELKQAQASIQEIAIRVHTLSHQLHPAKLRLLGLVQTLHVCEDHLIEELHDLARPRVRERANQARRATLHHQHDEARGESVAGNVAWALRKRKPWSRSTDDRFIRLDLRYCCARGTIEGLEINGKGTSETTAARRHIEKAKLHIADRGIFSFAYLRKLT